MDSYNIHLYLHAFPLSFLTMGITTVVHIPYIIYREKDKTHNLSQILSAFIHAQLWKVHDKTKYGQNQVHWHFA